MKTTTRMRLGGAALAAAALLIAGCGTGSAGFGDEAGAGTPAAGAGATAADAAEPTGGPEPATGQTAATTGTPRCTAGELQVSLGEEGAAAGSVYRSLVFTNTGARTCQLTGFPGVSYVAGDDGHQVGPAAARSGPRGVEVRMGPGGTSAAQLRLVQVRNFDEAVCRPTPVRGLRVYPPGETAAMFVPMEVEGCAGDPPSPQLTVMTITAR